MIDGILHFLQRVGHYLARMNEQFFFHVDVETNVSWAIIILMIGLYKLVEKYFSDQKLTSDELLKLLVVYIAFLLVVIASYTDLRRLLNDPDRDSSFIMFVVLMLMLVVIIGRLGVSTDAARKKKWMLVALYLPLLWIILTNGRVLEERMDSVRGLLPRSNATFVNLPGEMMDLEIGGRISDAQSRRIQTLLRQHPDVRDSGVVGRRDLDGLVKLMGVVVLREGVSGSDGLERDIIDFMDDRIRDELENTPREIGAVEVVGADVRLPAPGPNRYEAYEIALRKHRAVAEAAVEERYSSEKDRDILVGRVRLAGSFQNADEARRESLEKDIRRFVNEETREVRLSDFMRPRWIAFVAQGALPKTGEGRIDFEELQKEQRNWSRLFRALDVPSPDPEPAR
jgi:Ca2+/Na+ antiporter